jgi:DNA replication protein DnaC
MAYSAEVLSRARARLAMAKEDRESENREHLQQAYAQVPRLKEIDRLLRLTMAQAAQAAFAQGGDPAELLEQARRENLLLQQERAELEALYFEEGFLDDSPICDRCGGSGYVGSAMCECLRELCRQEQKKELTFLNVGRESFDQFRLEYYPDREDPKFGVNIRTIMEKTYQTCRRYAQNFSERSSNLLFSGDTGLGKTFLSACIARTVADNGYSVMYESAGHLFANLERAKFSGDEQARKESDRYFACDLLIVDDLGTEMPGQFTTAALYGLINDRLLAGKPTIISTNLTIEEFERRYNRQIASRLRGSYVRVPFLGEDIRVQKNRGL